jgi:PKD repeat protein
MRRKLFSYVLIAALLASFALPFVPVREAEASEMMFRYNEATDTFDGSSNDVKASPDRISYRTVGWTVTKVPTNGNPLAYTHGVMLDNDGNPGFQIREDPPNAGPGEAVRTFFAVPRTVLEQALKDADLLDAVDGQTVYIHSIFRIENSPKNAGKLFYTLDQILAAENWSPATRENLRMRFDNPITFQSPKYDGDAVVRLVRADATVEELPPENVVKGVKAGTPFSYTLSDTISRDGKTYQLYKSYIRYKLKPEVEHFPQFEGDPGLKTRNPTVAVGGTDIVGVYREQQTQKPDLVAVDIAPNGPIEVGKPASFTAKWRVDHQATGKPYNVKIMVDGGELKLVSQPAGGPGNYSADFTYTFTSTAQKTFLLAVDSANAIAETNENNNQVSKSFKPGSATPEPEDPPANACTVPPVARITAPSTKMAGELVEISGAESEASAPAAITEYRWQLEGTDSTITGTGGYAVYMMPGSYTIALQVTDSNGCTGTATWRIAIEAPVPTAFPDYAGTLKENRKVTLDGTRSFSPPGYPIISYEWSIRPVSGGSASAVKYSGALSGSRKDILVKQAGTYIVELTVTNSYGLSASASLPMTIVPDEPPVAVFTVVKEVLRDPARGMKAPLKARDASYSPDGDMIAQRIWSYRYDSDNDGDFDDEAVVIIDSGNKTEIEHLVPDVGRYRIYLEVVEDFGQPTIQQFIASGDYRRGQSWN